MNGKAVSGTVLTALLACMLLFPSSIELANSREAPLGFDMKVEPEHPTVDDEVNVTVTFLDVPSISYGFGVGPLTRVNNEFSVDINVSIPFIVVWAYVGNVTYKYELGKLSEGSYNFSATVHYWLQRPDGTWPSSSSDYSYRESFTVFAVSASWTIGVVPHYSYVHDGLATINISIWGVKASDHLFGIQFRLSYDLTVLQIVNLTEGPFMQDPRWNLHGTFFTISNEVDPVYGPTVLINDLLLPDSNGNWTAFPEGDGTLVTVRFQAKSNKTSQGDIWTPVHLSDGPPGVIRLTPPGDGWICLVEEAKTDVNMDGRVDMKDLSYVAVRFGSSPSDNRWSPSADINSDDRIDMKDLSTVAKQFGKIYEVPPDAGIPPL